MAGAAGWHTERETAIQAARQAGRILLDWSGRFTIRKKGLNDVVTEADHAAQDVIRKTIARRFPDDDFLGEEGEAAPRTDSKRRWIVDPLDGTMNYVHGLPFYCTSIGLEVDGEVVVGVVLDPVRQECFSGVVGIGADCNGRALQVSSADAIAEALLCAGLPADLSKDRTPLEVFTELSAQSLSIRRLGSAALAMAYIAAGRLDAFWSHTIQSWDVAAGVALVHAAGGRATLIDGAPYSTSRNDVLATNGLLHAQLTTSLASAGKKG